MTSGNPLKLITKFSIPIMLGQLLQLAYNMADTVIVGRILGTDALAAVGSTGMIFSFFTCLTIGLMSGFSVVCGKKYGAGDPEGLKKVYVNGLMITFLLCVLFTCSGVFLASDMLVLMNAPDKIFHDAHTYLVTVFAGFITTMLYNFFGELMRAVGNSKRPFMFLFISSIINIVLDLLFVGVFDMGVFGAAFATVIAQAVSAVLCFAYMYINIDVFRVSLKDFVFHKATAFECLRIGIPAMVLQLAVMSGLVIKQAFLNDIGTDYIAASSAASKLVNLFTIPINGFVLSMAVYVAQNYGARDFKRIRQGIRQTLVVTYAVDIFLLLFSLVASGHIIAFMVGSQETSVITNGKLYVNIHMFASLGLIPLVTFKSALQSLGRPLFPTISGFVEVGVRLISVIWLVRYLGFVGVALTDPFTWLVTGLFFVSVYAVEIKKVQKELCAVENQNNT